MKRNWIVLSGCLVCLLMVTGCLGGKSVVPLTYPDELADTPWCRWNLAVVDFEDARPMKRLGAMDEETDYTAQAEVAEWVTRAMTREFEARGCTCDNVMTKEAASEAEFMVSGKVLAVTLDKIGFNQWSTRTEILVELTRGDEMVFGQTYTGTVERTFVVASNGPEEIMAEGLSDILGDAAAKMTQAMKAAHR